ncbi:outer membrane beta-barrel protein [Candidatus Thiothrix anitrata]|uniref:Outer membrane beta-barrel protein n=1 Tax=Candidatus Thiothrix anitrata TaxID=2823902 RepID=A0ABX7WZL2_9GAMM|nr:outer membrane beta-barrel protein [Candidatus Thiothrix anitrata]QTR48597.1 outer membrane beta-barrel protein [Candidatus Thiothrix anitrata]
MKTHFSCALAGLMLLTNAAQAGGGLEGFGVPSNMDFYGGGSIGMASQDGACGSIANAKGCDDSDQGYKIFGGARLKPNTEPGALPSLGVEGGYINFGESSATGDLIHTRLNLSEDHGDITASSELSGIYAAGVAFMPVAPKTEVLAKAGVMRWSQKNERKQTVIINGTPDPLDNRNESTSSSSSGFGGLLGVGAQYQMTDNLSVRGEYERGFGIGKDANKTEPSLLSVGAVFSTY